MKPIKKPKCKDCRRREQKNGGYCWTCTSRRKRIKNPVAYAFSNLRSNAKRRGKAFELTFEQFKQFCVQTDYIAGVGRSKNSYSIDRIDNDKGYTIDNIQVMKFGENASKGKKKILHYDWQHKTAFVSSQTTQESNDGFPF